MPVGDLNTKKSWRTLIAELNSELAKWGLEDVILPTLRESEQSRSVTLKLAPRGEWIELACGRFGNQINGPQRNLHAIGQVVRTLRLADQRGIGQLMAEAAAKMLSLADPEDPYAILDVRPGAPLPDVRAAYIKAIKNAHPDRGGSSEEFQRVQDAGKRLGVAS